jgi:uncharacterized protein YjbI with pentapeptide repeats
MTNRSIIEGEIDFVNSHLEKIDATNDSLINNLYFSDNYNNPGTFIENLNMNGSYLQDINLNNSVIFDPSLDRSSLINLHGDGLNFFVIDLSLSVFNFLSLGTVSNLTSGSSAKIDEYKYITQVNMDGSNGYGLTDAFLDINNMLVPAGSYVDKLSINCSELTYSGSSATFSFSILGLTPILDIAVSDISNNVKVFDISNGLNLSRSVSDGLLGASLLGGTNITSGSIYLNITLKLNPFS